MSKATDLLGKKLNHLFVIKRLPNDDAGNTRWLCKCDCGREKVFRGSDLQRKPPRCCGCEEYKYRPEIKNLIGRRFGRLTVKKRIENTKSGNIRWYCECDCGGVATPTSWNLLHGESKSCGCLRNELRSESLCIHGGARKGGCRLYHIWIEMKRRCEKADRKTAGRYFERGIRVCDEWKQSYKEFENWSLRNGYSDDLSIDRIDNNGNYCPENCRWVSRIAQMRNTSYNVFLEYNGENYCIAEWAEKLGVNYQTLWSFIYRGGKDYVTQVKRLKTFIEKLKGHACNEN